MRISHIAILILFLSFLSCQKQKTMTIEFEDYYTFDETNPDSWVLEDSFLGVKNEKNGIETYISKKDTLNLFLKNDTILMLNNFFCKKVGSEAYHINNQKYIIDKYYWHSKEYTDSDGVIYYSNLLGLLAIQPVFWRRIIIYRSEKNNRFIDKLLKQKGVFELSENEKTPPIQ